MKFTSYPHGTPCWIDLGSSDLAAAKDFYAELFGWQPETNPDPQYGDYTMFQVGADAVAGVGPLMSPEQPVVWVTYFATDDADATIEAVQANGGAVLAPAIDIGDQGRMAICADPEGAAFGIWQKNAFAGAQLANEPNSWCWSELRSGDPEAATRFLAAVFGTDSEVTDMDGMPYTSVKVGGKSVAGVMPMGDMFPPGTPPHWAVYFAVTDADHAAATVEKLGGQVFGPAMEAEGVGRWVAVADPQGAPFMVMRM